MRTFSKVFRSFSVFFFFCDDCFFFCVISFANEVEKAITDYIYEFQEELSVFAALTIKSIGTLPLPPHRKRISINNTTHIKTIKTAERSAEHEGFAICRRDVFSSMVIFGLTTSLINGSTYKRIRWSFPAEICPCAFASHPLL